MTSTQMNRIMPSSTQVQKLLWWDTPSLMLPATAANTASVAKAYRNRVTSRRMPAARLAW